MFNIVPISLFIVSLGGLIYIVSNHLSELGREDVDEFEFGIRAKFVEWINRLPLDDVKSHSISLTQKMLHRTRLLLLKADNQLMKIIGKISEEKEKKENGDKNDNFWEGIANGKRDERVEEPFVAEPFVEPEVKIDLVVKKSFKTKKFLK